MSERFEIKPSINKTGYVVIDNKKQYTFPIMSKDDCYMFCKVLNALHEENTQIKSTIKEAYQSERTMIGKSVLKQLMETIQ